MDTARLGGLLDGEPKVVAAGAPILAEALQRQAVPVERVDWRPPPDEAVEALNAVLGDPRHGAANATAVERMLAARPRLVDVRPASQALGLEKGTFLHCGPPLEWDRASGPMRGALIGAMLLEGLASSPEEAERALEGGAATLEPCHRHGAVGPAAGVVSPSTPVFVVEDEQGGRVRRSYCPLGEGPGEVLRYGAHGPEAIERLRWMSAVLGPVLQDAVRRHGPVDLTAITAQALQMGDELHHRTRAATSLLVRELAADIIAASAPASDLLDALRFLTGDDRCYLSLAMAAAKAGADAARGVPGSSVVVAMAGNGTDFGIQVSGTGDRWFTGPAGMAHGPFPDSYGPREAASGIGDSAIMETVGLGGFAMAAAPAIVRSVGGELPGVLAATQRMYEITLAEHPVFQVPILSFRGVPAGIDVTRVVRTGILPVIGTGAAGRLPDAGRVDAGPVTPPAEVFGAALKALATLAG